MRGIVDDEIEFLIAKLGIHDVPYGLMIILRRLEIQFYLIVESVIGDNFIKWRAFGGEIKGNDFLRVGCHSVEQRAAALPDANFEQIGHLVPCHKVEILPQEA